MTVRLGFSLLLITATALLAGCSNGPVIEPELSSIFENVIQGGCDSESCHGGSTPEADMDFGSLEATYAALVGVEAVEEPTFTRVVAGDSDNSLMYLVLLGDVGTVDQMPPGYSLTADEIEAIREWIDLGAENN